MARRLNGLILQLGSISLSNNDETNLDFFRVLDRLAPVTMYQRNINSRDSPPVHGSNLRTHTIRWRRH